MHPPVEGLDAGVLPWRSRIDKHGVNMVELAPVRDRIGNKFWPVVETDEPGRTAPLNAESVNTATPWRKRCELLQ